MHVSYSVLLYLPLVGRLKKNAYEVIFPIYELVKDDQRVIALDCERVLKSANDKYIKLRRLVHDIDHWSHDQYISERRVAEETMNDFDNEFQLMLDYHSSLKAVKKELGERDPSEKKEAGSRSHEAGRRAYLPESARHSCGARDGRAGGCKRHLR